MDAKRFDSWIRNRALRLSRRDALRLAGAGGAAAALASLSSNTLAEAPCSLTIHAETAAGPSTPTSYDGTLQFTLGTDGAFAGASFTPSSGGTLSVTGQATGRAIDFQIELAQNQWLTFSGVGDQSLDTCPGNAAGLLSGPQPADLGAWQSNAGTQGASSVPTLPASSSQTNDGSSSSTTNQPAQPECLADQTPCDDSSQCCSGFCTDGECRSCGGIVCDNQCIDPNLDSQNCGGCGNICTGECVDGACNTCGAGGAPCADHPDCCDSICTNGTCRCAELNEPCRDHTDCCLIDTATCAQIAGAFVCRLSLSEPCTTNSECVFDTCTNGECG